MEHTPLTLTLTLTLTLLLLMHLALSSAGPNPHRNLTTQAPTLVSVFGAFRAAVRWYRRCISFANCTAAAPTLSLCPFDHHISAEL